MPAADGSPPSRTCTQAIRLLRERDIEIPAISPLYESEPVPPSDQPWFVNGVFQAETDMDPLDFLDLLLAIEKAFGRERGERNAPRVLDLDIIDWDGLVRPGETWPEGGGLILPHPRMHDRAFVLEPLKDIASDWRHPVLKKTAGELLSGLESTAVTRPLKMG